MRRYKTRTERPGRPARAGRPLCPVSLGGLHHRAHRPQEGRERSLFLRSAHLECRTVRKSGHQSLGSRATSTVLQLSPFNGRSLVRS